MKISIIIPAYNEEKYLRDCLEHVFAQSINAEVLVVDNASVDTTAIIARSFMGVTLLHEPTAGVNHARQLGLSRATGDLIAFVDADTLMPPDWLEKAVAEFQNNPQTVLLSGPYVYFDHPLIERIAMWIFWRFFAYPTYLMTGYLAIGGNSIARRSALEQSGGFDESIEFYGDDADFARRMKKIGRVKFSLNFFMYTSARRLHEEGLIIGGVRYIYNYLAVVFTKRPKTLRHRNIR